MADKAVEALQKAFDSNDYEACKSKIRQLKLLFAEQNLLVPQTAQEVDKTQLVLVRRVFEITAFVALRTGDIGGLSGAINGLQSFYALPKDFLPKSVYEPRLVGLNLLRLLSENKIAEFHMLLEHISEANSPEIQFAVQLEEWVMEGAYNRVWTAVQGIAENADERIFVDDLIQTIRLEIASCISRAYVGLAAKDAQSLLFMSNNSEAFRQLLQQLGWTVIDGKINFNQYDQMHLDIPKKESGTTDLTDKETIKQFLNYARELERIV